jgi:hypothetical protein
MPMINLTIPALKLRMVFRIIGGLLSRVVAETGIPYLLCKKTAIKNSGCRGIDSRCIIASTSSAAY